MASQDRRNLIIVSNRLPLSVKRVDGEFKSSLSSGGLVTSLSGLTKSTEFQWFGWPGMEVKDPKDREGVVKSLAEYNAVPIFLDADLAHEHYNKFSSIPPLPPLLPFPILTNGPRLHPLAQPALPKRRRLRRPPLAGLQTRERMFRRRGRQRRHAWLSHLGPRLPSHAISQSPSRPAPAARERMRDRLFASYALPGGGFLAHVAGSQGLD